MNSIFSNDTNISALHIGNDDVKKVYFGSTLIYEETPPIPNYFQFKAVNGNATVSMSTGGTSSTIASPSVSYSRDGSSWASWGFGNLSIPSGSTVYFKGSNSQGFSKYNTNLSKYKYMRFNISGQVECHGSVQSLIWGDNFENNLTLPQGGSRIKAGYTFYCLFSGCTGLLTAPELPATATTENCYYSMFYGCSNLKTAPVLPSKSIASQAYNNMFRSCSKLNYIKAMFTTTPSTSVTGYWVSGVASSGTYVKNSSASYTDRGVSAIPNNWTVETASS